MTEMYVTFIPVESGTSDCKSMAFLTSSSGLAKNWAEENAHVNATYHTITVGSALPID